MVGGFLFRFAVDGERIVDYGTNATLAVEILCLPKGRSEDGLGFQEYLRPRGAGDDEHVPFFLRNHLQEFLEICSDNDDCGIDRGFEVELSDLKLGNDTAVVYDFVLKTQVKLIHEFPFFDC